MKILLVSTAWPWPARKGYQLRTAQFVEALRQRHDLTLLLPAARSRTPPPPGPPVATEVAIETYVAPSRSAIGGVGRALVSGRALESGLVSSPDLRRRLLELVPEFDLTIAQLVRLSGVTDVLRGRPWMLDLVDSLSLNLSRRAEFDRPWFRPLLRFEARRLAADERRGAREAARALLVSERDRLHLASRWPEELASRLAVVPLALPPSSPSGEERPARLAGETTFVITGNLGYFPTARGVAWLLDRVWPEVVRKFPRVRLRVAGARPPRALARKVRRLGGEVVVDPPDLQALLSAADVALAPLLAGSGTPIKLLEALAAGVPAVATPAAAEGLDPALARCVAIPEDAASWVTTLYGLVANPVAARARAAIGARLVREIHDPKRIQDLLEAQIAAAVTSAAGRRSS